MDKEKFHFPQKHYFLSHSVGAQPRSYDAALADGYGNAWRTEQVDPWGKWFSAIDRFREGLAPIIGADPQEICPQSNVSSGITKALFSLPERKGRRKIVLTEDDFPTVGFALAQAQRLGYEIEFLPGGEHLSDPEAWAPAFQDDVQLLLTTHVFSNTSVLSPCAEITARARHAGVYSILDIAQAAGAVPVDLKRWAPDFAVGTSLKYLCAGTGAAFLWVNPETADQCEPMDVGWFSHADPFEMDIRHFEYADGAARFTGGTPSVAPFAGAAAGHAIINAHGVDTIYAYNQRLLSQLFASLPQDCFLSTTRQGARGSAALIRVSDFDGATAALRAASISHDSRKGAVRISVHLYNDEDDIGALVKAISPFVN